MQSHTNIINRAELGVVPQNWRIVKIGDVATIKGGKRLPEGHQIVDFKTPFPYIRVVDFRAMGVKVGDLKFLLPETQKLIRQYTISSEDVYISIAGTVGIAGLIPSELDGANLTENAAKLCNLRHVTKEFLAYMLNSSLVQRQINSFMGKAQQPKLALFRIEKIELPLPPLPEQQKIAEILSTVDEAIAKVDEAIRKTEKLKKGLMHELLTKGIGHKEFKETEIGRIPKEWEVLTIKDIGKIITGKTPPTDIDKYWNGDIPFITPVDMQSGKYVYETERYITAEGARKVGNLLPKDSILVVCIGSTIGKTALTYRESISNQQINTIVPSKSSDAHYVYYAILFKSDLLRSFAGTAAVPIVKKSLFETLKLPFPPNGEQKKISEILSAVDKKLELLQNKRKQYERIKKGLMNDLLTGKKRVKTTS